MNCGALFSKKLPLREGLVMVAALLADATVSSDDVQCASLFYFYFGIFFLHPARRSATRDDEFYFQGETHRAHQRLNAKWTRWKQQPPTGNGTHYGLYSNWRQSGCARFNLNCGFLFFFGTAKCRGVPASSSSGRPKTEMKWNFLQDKTVNQ